MKPRAALHVFSTLGRGGPQVRAMQLCAQLGGEFKHMFVALDGNFDALELLPRSIAHEVLPVARLPMLASIRRFAKLLRERQPDLLLTYNWGAIEAVAAARWLGMRAFVHHEDGFGAAEQVRRLRRRNWLRRALLRSAAAVIVPSQQLLAIAQREWRLTDAVRCLPNGVDLTRFAPASAPPAAARGFTIGTVGGLRGEKDHATLLRAVALMKQPARVLLIGDGPMRPQLAALARELQIEERVTLAGACSDPAPLYRTMDAFVLSSRTEQMPLSLLEAMASGLPCASTEVGDVRAMLPQSCGGAIVPPGAAAQLGAALDELATDAARRSREGGLNRAHCCAHYELTVCLDRFLAIYRQAASP
ncbi:MAG: glycosyltransferase [Planctomycetota bacterium]|jgi:glycosyltransferase involved in cell wall biosynthesis